MKFAYPKPINKRSMSTSTWDSIVIVCQILNNLLKDFAILSIPLFLYMIYEAIKEQTKWLKSEDEIDEIGNN